MVNILVSGYIGYGNCGDDAILSALCEGIRKLDIECSITALSHKPNVTIKDNDINAIYRFNWKEVIKAIKNAQVVISGGGSLLQDRTSTRSLLYYLGIIFVAKLFNKKVMLYANGIGPISRRFNRLLTKYIVNRVDIITLRDELSGKDLKAIGVTKPPIFITADPVFSLNSDESKDYNPILADSHVPMNKPIVGVLFRDWFCREQYVTKMARLCDDLIERKDVNVLFIPMEYEEDIAISKEIMSHMKNSAYVIDQKLDYKTIIGLIGELHMILSMRLHALIFAALQNIPMIGFVYDPKVKYFLSSLELPSAGNIEDLDMIKINKLIDEIYMNYDSYINKLNNVNKNMKKKSMLNNKYLHELIKYNW